MNNNLTTFFETSQPLIEGYIDRLLLGEIKFDGKRLFQEFFCNSRRRDLFVQLRYDIEQLIIKHFHRRSLALSVVMAQLDDLVSLQKLCRPVMVDSLQEYYYSFVTVTVATNLANKAFNRGLDGFALPCGVAQAAENVAWGSMWMAEAGLKPAVEKRRCAALLNQALQGLMANWQLAIKQELLRTMTDLLYDLHDQTAANGVYSKQQAKPITHYRISQRLPQAM